MRKLCLALTILLLAASLIGCTNDKPEPVVSQLTEITPPPPTPSPTPIIPTKIAVLCADGSAGHTAALKLQSEDEGQRIIIDTLPAEYYTNPEAVMVAVMKHATNPEVAVIILAEAVEGAAEAVRAAKEAAPDIKIIAAADADEAENVAEYAYAVLTYDPWGNAEGVVSTAIEMGCDLVCFFTFARHLVDKDIADYRIELMAACKACEIQLLDMTISDPLGSRGLDGVMQDIESGYLISDIKKYHLGSSPVFLTSEPITAQPIADYAEELGYAYIDLLSPYDGLPSNNASIPADACEVRLTAAIRAAEELLDVGSTNLRARLDDASGGYIAAKTGGELDNIVTFSFMPKQAQ